MSGGNFEKNSKKLKMLKIRNYFKKIDFYKTPH